MASKTDPQPAPMTSEDFSGIMAAHRQWLDSGGKEGKEAKLVGANLQGLDLSGYNLSGLDFREANLARVKFGEAHVEGANFKAADLREADLSGVRGLLAPKLAGADLAGARLPEEFKEFAALKHVDAASDDVQKLFLILLLVCVYCWLTIAITKDVNFFGNHAEQALPIIGTKISLVGFYWAAPLLLLCIHLYFQLCLQRLWEALAELPAVFPDGLPLPRRIHPWLWNGLVWAYSPLLRDRRPPLMGLQKFLAISLVWGAAPLTILAMWFRSLPAHDQLMIIFQPLLLTLALDGALGFFLLTRATLRLRERESFRWRRLWQSVKGFALTLAAVAIFALFFYLSLGSYFGAIGRFWVSANLRNADVSLKPPQWKPGGDLDLVQGAILYFRNLRRADASGAFLAKADLLLADLEYADLSKANLQQAQLSGADLRYTNLSWADLSQADLWLADLRRANLSRADFQGARRLEKEQVLASASWPLAKYSPEMLESLQLPPEHNKNIEHKNLSGYQLPGADLRGALLPGFNLRGIDLRGADLEKASLEGADLTGADLRQANLKSATLHEEPLPNIYSRQFLTQKKRGAILKGADLREAKGLTREQLKSAIMDENTKLPDEFKDLIPSAPTKPKENK